MHSQSDAPKWRRSINLVIGLFALGGLVASGPLYAQEEASLEEADPAVEAMNLINAELEAQGEDYFLYKMEAMGVLNTPGRTVILSDRGNGDKDLADLAGTPVDWIPFDLRRVGSPAPPALSFAVDNDGTGDTGGEFDAIRRSFATWNAVECSDIPLTDQTPGAFDLGIIQFILGLGGSPFIFADITHAGWQPQVFFNFFGFPNAGAVTFTFVFGTDLDGDGKLDTFFTETYYNDGIGLPWGVDVDLPAGIDVETVALHENGHALAQAHFGDVFFVNNGASGFRLKASPPALMNAFYTGLRQELGASDRGGHCDNWAVWPEK